jgi:hypothetical protein
MILCRVLISPSDAAMVEVGLVMDRATLIWLFATLSMFFYHVNDSIGRKRDLVAGFSFWVSKTRHPFCSHCWFRFRIKDWLVPSRSEVSERCWLLIGPITMQFMLSVHEVLLVFLHWLGRMEAATHHATTPAVPTLSYSYPALRALPRSQRVG